MKYQTFNSLQWPIYVFNLVVNTKLPVKQKITLGLIILYLFDTDAKGFFFICLTSGYYIGLGLVSPELHLFNPARGGGAANILLLVCLGIALGGVICARYWSWNKW